MQRFEDRIKDGYLYGDFQFATDADRRELPAARRFLVLRTRSGRHADHEDAVRFSPEDWTRLLRYSPTRTSVSPSRSTRSGTWKRPVRSTGPTLSSRRAYVDHYHHELDRVTGSRVKGSEMITEIYVERARLTSFLDEARDMLRALGAN